MKNNKLDEMQEQKLLRIEHNGCWGAFWGLLLAMIIQMLTGAEPQAVAGEWTVFMLLAIYLGVACVRAGIWDRRLEMNFKTNLLISVIAAAAAGLFLGFFTYVRYQKPQGSLAAGLIIAGCTFVLCLVALTVAARITKKRQLALEREPDEEI